MSYIADTKWVITSSKLKLFKDSPLAFKVIYSQLSPAELAIFESEWDHFSFWTMTHDFLEKINGRPVAEVLESFLCEYNITNRYQKWQLVELILAEEAKTKPLEDLEVIKKKLEKLTLPQLREQRYWSERYAEICKKKEITRAEARDLILWESEDSTIPDSIIKVALSNKDWDIYGKYDNECSSLPDKRIQTTFRWMPISAKPDRIVIYKGEERYTLAEYMEIVGNMTPEEKRAYAKENKIKGFIRDYKTTESVERLIKDIQYKWDCEFQYVFSQAFYYIVVYSYTGVECDVCLDLIEKAKPFFSCTYYLPKDKLKEKVVEIKWLLENMKVRYETGDRGDITASDIVDNKKLKR